MSEVRLAFGRELLSVASIEDGLVLEAKTDRRQQFLSVDSLLEELLASALQGVRVAKLLRDDVRGARAAILIFKKSSQDPLNEMFALHRQQGRGAWYLPDSVSLKLGLANLVAYFRTQPRFALGMVSEDRANVTLSSSPDALCLWALVERFFDLLWLPLQMRGPLAGTLSRDEFDNQWQQVITFFNAMALPCDDELERLQYGCGWDKLSAAQQLDRKLALITAVGAHYSGDLAARFRMYRIRQLAERHYSKANAQGQAERRKVLTKAYYAVLSGVFAGDWMAFLKYLGETPHPNEHVATALPETRLYLTDTSKVAAVATVANISPAEVQRMVAAFWDRPGVAVSPIEERVAVLRRYWQVFDEIHTRQKSGMESLWGLIEARGLSNVDGGGDSALYRPNLYRTLLPEGLISEIGHLWSGTTLPMHPEIIVTEIFPHALMTEAFGPALDFWHGCALTAWFIAEGPRSRTDMAGLAHQHRGDLAELQDLGCSVDPKLFRRLIEVEATLGPPQPIEREQSTTQSTGGLFISVSMTIGSRRGGFEKLRDVITQCRTEWADKNLEQYLRARWERQLKAVAEDYNRCLHEKGRPPTLNQFAKVAAEVADHWFGGDLTGVYGVIGAKISQRPTRRTIMPADRLGFAQSVYKAIGGQPIERRILTQRRNQDQPTEQQRQYSLAELARLSLPYLQLEEALGRSPTLKEFGESRFETLGHMLAEKTEEAWKKYGEAIRTVMESQRTPTLSSTDNVVMKAAPTTARESPARVYLEAPTEALGPGEEIEAPKPKSWFRRLFSH